MALPNTIVKLMAIFIKEARLVTSGLRDNQSLRL